MRSRNFSLTKEVAIVTPLSTARFSCVVFLINPVNCNVLYARWLDKGVSDINFRSFHLFSAHSANVFCDITLASFFSYVWRIYIQTRLCQTRECYLCIIFRNLLIESRKMIRKIISCAWINVQNWRVIFPIQKELSIIIYNYLQNGKIDHFIQNIHNICMNMYKQFFPNLNIGVKHFFFRKMALRKD